MMRRFGLIAAAALTAAVVASPASAEDDLGSSHGVHYFSETGDDQGPVDLTCPDGTDPTGGGFEQPAIAGRPFWSFPLGDSWRVFMHVPSMGAQEVNGYVMCKGGTLRHREKDLQIGAGKTKSAKVGCPGARHVAGGGGLLNAAPGDGWINSSYPVDDGDRGRRPDDGWRVRIYNDDGDSHVMEVHAICQRRQPRYVQESRTLPPGSSSATFPGCRSSEAVIGAAIRVGGQASSGIPRALVPSDSGDSGDVPDDRVLANASNEVGAPKDKRITGFAICD
jgi:hypothetical protein